MLATLELELDRMTARIETLTRNRDAVAEYLTAVRKTRRPGPRHVKYTEPPSSRRLTGRAS
jgi:hypothetical protein